MVGCVVVDRCSDDHVLVQIWHGSVRVEDRAFTVNQQNAVRRTLDQRTPAFLGVLYGLFGLVPLGDVTHDGDPPGESAFVQ